MAKLITFVVAAALVAVVVSDDVLDALSCDFSNETACQWCGGGWTFYCGRPRYCYIATAVNTSYDTLHSIEFNNSQPICFFISYSFDEAGYSSINVSLSGKTLFNTTNQASKIGWHQANMTIPSGNGQQLLLVATTGAIKTTAFIDSFLAKYGTC